MAERIEQVLKDINAELQKQSIDPFQRLDYKNIGSVPRISSGVPSLDVVLGGGYPIGRIVEVYGQNASGKCLVADTYIATITGLKTIAEIFEESGVVPSCATKTTERKVKLLNRYKEYEETTHFTNNGRRPVFKLKTKTGNEIKSTANHPHMIMSKNGNWVWRRTEQLRPGDYLVCARGGGVRNFSNEGCDLSYFLGNLVADGSFQRGRVSIKNNDSTVVSIIETIGPQVFGVNPKKYPQRNTTDFNFNSVENVSNFYKIYGFRPGVAKDKHIPLAIRCKESRRRLGINLTDFIRGYVDCECDIRVDNSTLELVSASHRLLFQLKHSLLMEYGIVSILSEKKVKAYPDNEYWRLCISGSDFRRYIEIIGFRSLMRIEQVQNVHIPKENHTNFDIVPNLSRILCDLYESSETTRETCRLIDSYLKSKRNPTNEKLGSIVKETWGDFDIVNRLQKIHAANYLYDCIESIELGEPEPTFDFTTSHSHSFVANGIITHNTSVTLQAIASAQSRGGVAVFLDTEHALDVNYARDLGVNIKDLLLYQPDYGEQALTVLDILTGSLKVGDLIIIDSVTALTPKAELEGDFDDQTPMRLAQLMSRGLSKLKGKIAGSGVIALFTNQMRATLKYGNTTTGGNALKFYASQRIELKSIGKVRQGDDIIGNMTQINVVKNKVAPPFRKIVTEIRFGEGIPLVLDLINLGMTTKPQIVETKGTWFSYRGTSLGQGKTNAYKFLQANPEILANIEAEVRGAYGLVF